MTVTPKNFGINELCAYLYREARALDDRQWEDWLAFYHDDVEYWMPSWDDFDRLVDDPLNEMSLIYYPNKDGLQDRVFRIKTDRSSATSLPEPRTSHNICNVEILGTTDTQMTLRFNWTTHNYRYHTTDSYWGTSFYTLDFTSGQPLITKKKIVLKNDRIHHVIDVYHI